MRSAPFSHWRRSAPSSRHVASCSIVMRYKQWARSRAMLMICSSTCCPISAHKMYGPKGVGALYVRKTRPRRIKMTPLLDGGGHERGLRSGTLNVPGIVGLGKACEIGMRVWPEEGERLTRLRERFVAGVMQGLDHTYLNGHPTQRLPNNVNLSFAGVDAEALIMGMTEVACSSGSACTSTTLEPSYVLRAMGLDDALVHASIRFGLGRWTTTEEVEFTVQTVVSRVQALARVVATV